MNLGDTINGKKMSDFDKESIIEIREMIFNLSVHMLHDHHEAEDATQSVMEKIIINYPGFKGESGLSTWAYRIGYNFLIDRIRKKEKETIPFSLFESDINHFVPYNNEFGLTREEEKIYVEEVKTGCTLAMLQCLNPQDRFAYILANIFSFSSAKAAEIMNLNGDQYRKRVSRARKKIRNFMNSNCGLVNKSATCQCRKRLKIADRRGRITIGQAGHKTAVRRIMDLTGEIEEMDEISKIYRSNPFYEQKEIASRLIDQFRIFKEE